MYRNKKVAAKAKIISRRADRLTWIIFMGLYPLRTGDDFFGRARIRGGEFLGLYS